MTNPPPPPLPGPSPEPVGWYPAPPRSASDRVRAAWQARAESDYIFDFPTALGWTILTCGFYGIYVVYQLVRRARDHNLRRIELLDAATTFAWEQANTRGLADELRPAFERIASSMATLRAISGEFRDPTLWAVISFVARGIVEIVVFILLDGDLVKHDYAEGAVEHELAGIYGRLGVSIAPPDPGRLKGRHNYGGRIAATIFSFGIYSLWWERDVMNEGNRHFQHNWVWEDNLAGAVQQLSLAT
ncbi:MAG: hypothetical protein QOI08_1623 [Actinomycetota bacterium]|nr:hypothetical protein [Actinomycetota bacterium]